MPPRKNGLRRSSATTFRRRLIIFRRLFRADCGASELIEAVNLELNHDGSPDPCIECSFRVAKVGGNEFPESFASTGVGGQVKKSLFVVMIGHVRYCL